MEREAEQIAPLTAYLSVIRDPRVEWNKLYPLDEVIIITILAVIALAQGWEDIERYVKAKKDWLGQYQAEYAELFACEKPENAVKSKETLETPKIDKIMSGSDYASKATKRFRGEAYSYSPAEPTVKTKAMVDKMWSKRTTELKKTEAAAKPKRAPKPPVLGRNGKPNGAFAGWKSNRQGTKQIKVCK
jgi:hypothetical protein